MFIEVGYFSICFALILAIYAIVSSVIFIYKSSYIALIESSRNAILACFFSVLLSSLSLWNAIFFHDFSIKYVFEHSALDMPSFYLFTSFWSALEGSHLLWTLILSFVCAICILFVKKSYKKEQLPILCIVFGICLFFMIVLNLTISQPFQRGIPTNSTGLGMNALLQNPYMAIHPPMLFLGYSSLIVPFAYSVLALIKGSIHKQWLSAVRRFTLLGWAILTVAIFLGGKWAYVVLGWGGYWAWDPVENASFMPWLATTAFLHTLLIYDRTKKLPRLTVFLGMFGFILTFFGTFLTRSGVVSSVHSFAESTIGPAYLAWIVFLSTCSIVILFSRGHLLQEKKSFEPFYFSKESILLFTNYFLLFLLAVVFFGTVMPLIVEALFGTKISIQQPFYNAFAPWIGLILVSILGIGNLAKWKSAKLENPLLSLIVPLFISLCMNIYFIVVKNLSLFNGIIYFLVLWTLCVLIADFLFKLKQMRFKAIAFLKFHRSYLGALIIHIGFLTAILGFSGSTSTISSDVSLPLNHSVEFHGFTLTNKGLTFEKEYNEIKVSAVVEAKNNHTQEEVFIQPARTKFTNNEQWFNEVGVESKLWYDLYLVLTSFNTQDESIDLKINFNPMVKLVWTSVVLMFLGALLGLTSKIRFESKNTTNNSSKILSYLLIFTIIGLTAFGLSGVAYAQTISSEDEEIELNSKIAQQTLLNSQIEPQTSLKEVGKDLRCPTCLGMSILESDTPQSIAMRNEVQKLIHEGKTKPEIVKYFKDSYGSWILRKPDASTVFGKILWGIPIFGLICGPFILLWRLRPKKMG